MMKKQNILFITFIAAITFVLLSTGISQAISVTASPNPQVVNRNVTVLTTVTTGTTSITDPFYCTTEINYGDSSTWYEVGRCNTIMTGEFSWINNTCRFTTTHAYTTPASIYINARIKSGKCAPPPTAEYLENVICAPITITSPSPFPPATVGQPYTYQLQASGGQGPFYNFHVTGCEFICPFASGLTLGNTGLITGTPTTSGNYSVTITATDSCPVYNYVQKTFSIAVNCPTMSITSPATLPSSVTDQAYNYNLQTLGGIPPVTYNIASGQLPPGLSLSSTGQITGSPRTSGSYSFTVNASGNCITGVGGGLVARIPIYQNAQKTFSIIVCPALSITSSPTLPPATVGQAYTSQIQISGGQTPVTFSGIPPPGLSLSSSGLISGTPTAAGPWSFGVTAADMCPAAAQSVNQIFSLVVNPAPVSCTPLNITSSLTLPKASIGQAYTYQLQTSGGQLPINFSFVTGSLPIGLSISPAGLISGTPRDPGNYTFTIVATDSCSIGVQSVQRTFNLIVGCVPLNITSPSTLSPGTLGQAYTYQVKTSGGKSPVTFNLDSGLLPIGLKLSSTGQISGTPLSADNYSFTINATDSCPIGGQSDQKTFSIRTALTPQPCTPLNLTSPSTLSPGTVGQVYTYQVQASGGQSPVTFSLVSGSLPPGLNLSSTGQISGSPTTADNYSFVIKATDSCQTGIQSDQETFSIQVKALPTPVTISVTPSSFSVPRGQSSTNSINYLFTGSPSLTTTLTSSAGSFMVGSETIEANTIPLTAIIQNGSGIVTEMITIPVKVVERAIQRGANRFTYVRTFTGPDINLNATVNFAATTEAGASFDIKRIELYFENMRAETTIERNYPHLKAFADIRFVGSGLLEGYWDVDGRRLSTVTQNLLYGRSVTLETPEIPPLPTYDTGTHIVRFIITKPETEISLPSILYFVTPAEFKAILVDIKFMSPMDDSVIEYAPVRFEWEKLNKSTLFVIQYFDKRDSRPVFSAFTKDAFYTLPEIALKGIFSPGQKYYWKVIGYDAENNIIGESKVWSFTFRKFDAYVPGQILTVFTESTFSEKLVNELKEKHPIKLIDSFSLKSVNLSVVLFEATRKNDVLKIIEELMKDKRILIAQPNYIMRTMSDPLRKMQYVNDILNVDKIHSMYRGRGIKVAVLDTGVDANHSDLKDRVVFTKNFIRGEQYLAEIHGTAIAGVIAASINGFGIEGIAPDADILAMRSCEQVSKERPEGECFTESLSKALDEAIMRKVNIVNMSFGTTYNDSLITKLIDKGVEQGMLFIASAGNLPNETELEFPASYPSVIAVGGLDERLTPYPNPDITKKASASAPAMNIISTVPGNKYNFLSGTSMSSAYVSGILALALEKDKSITKQTLPTYKGDICKWEEELLKIKICEK